MDCAWSTAGKPSIASAMAIIAARPRGALTRPCDLGSCNAPSLILPSIDEKAIAVKGDSLTVVPAKRATSRVRAGTHTPRPIHLANAGVATLCNQKDRG